MSLDHTDSRAAEQGDEQDPERLPAAAGAALTGMEDPSPPMPRRRSLRVSADLRRPFASGLVTTLGVLVAVAFGLAFVNLSTVIISIVLALFLALGLDPLIKVLVRRGMSRGWAIAIVSAGFAALVVLVIWLVVPNATAQLLNLIAAAPEALAKLAATPWFVGAASALGVDADSLTTVVAKFLSDPEHLVALSGGLLSVTFGAIGAVSGTLIIVVLTLYFLASIEPMKSSFYRLTAAPSRPTVQRLTERITDSMGGFVMTMFVLGGCNAVLVFLLHLMLGLPYPALMALLAFFLTLIPIIGSVVFWIVGTVIALFSDPTAALIFALVYLAYMQVESYVMTPRLMSRAIAIPGILVVIGALTGGALLGMLGALVAVPTTAAILLIIKEVVFPRQDRVGDRT